MKSIVMIVAPVVLTIGVIAGAWQLKLIPPGTSAAAASPSDVATTSTQPALVNYVLPERVVNLADTPGYRYLKIQVTLAFADSAHRQGELQGDALAARQAAFKTQIDPYAPAMEDFEITTLTSKTAAQLLTPQGKDALRAELLDGLRKQVPTPTLEAVYFTEFVIQ